MKLKWVWVLLVVALFTVVALPPVNSFAEKKTTVLRLVVSTPPDDYPLGHSLNELAKKFNERAQGDYKIEIHAGGALAKLPEYFDAVRIGAVEMASAGWTIFSFLDPRLGAIELPFLYNNNAAANAAIKDILPLYDQILQEKFNAKGLGLFAFTASELMTVKPVKNLEEFKGILVGAISPVTASMAKDLGGSPVTIMWTDMYESLQKKVVDGTVFNIHAAKVMSLFDVCKYATISFGPASFQGLSINLAIWKKMPEPIKKILQEEADASNRWLGEMFAKMVQDEIKELGAKGVSFYMLPPAERARWVEATAANRDKQLASFGEFGEKIRQSAEAANQLHPYTE